MSATGSQRTTDANGFVYIARNPISKVGVFPYTKRAIQYPGWENDPNGIVQVYRPESALSNPETLDSFKLVPWIEDHTMIGNPDDDGSLTPIEKVGARGTTGANVEYDPNDRTMYSDLRLWSSSLADAIDAGKKDLSLGYRCVYEYTPGIFEGQRYDAIQTQLFGNHNASVMMGRMGPGVHVLDSAFQFGFDAKELQPMKVTRRIALAKKLGVTPTALAAACGMDGATAEELKRWNTAMDAEEESDGEGEGGGSGEPTISEAAEMIKDIAAPLGELQSSLAQIATGGTPTDEPAVADEDMEPVLDEQGQPVMDAAGKPKMQPKKPAAPAAVPPQLQAADSAIKTVKAVISSAKTKAKGKTVPGMDALETSLRSAETSFATIMRRHTARARSANPSVAALDARLAAAEATIKKAGEGMDSKTVIKAAMTEIANRDKLANHVSGFVGSFDSSEMTELEVAKYAIEKLKIPASDGAEVVAVKAWLSGRQPDGNAPATREGTGQDGFGPVKARKDVTDFVSGRRSAA